MKKNPLDTILLRLQAEIEGLKILKANLEKVLKDREKKLYERRFIVNGNIRRML